MNNIFYSKTVIYKIFNRFPVFSKTEIYNENQHDTDFDIVVNQNYYNEEFKTDAKKNN